MRTGRVHELATVPDEARSGFCEVCAEITEFAIRAGEALVEIT